MTAPHLTNDIRCSTPNCVTVEPVREAHGVDFYVYRGNTLVRLCSSGAMADEVVAGVRAEIASAHI